MLSKADRDYWETEMLRMASHLDNLIEGIKISLEEGSHTKSRRKTLAELITLMDMREKHSLPKPVSSIRRTDEEYRDEDYVLTQEFHAEKIAEFTAKGQLEVAHSLRMFAQNEEARYLEGKAKRLKSKPAPVKAKKTWLRKLFG